MNDENLIPLNKRAKKEQREIAKQGGIKSGEVRREKKKLKELLELALETEAKGGKTNAEAITISLIKQALGGNVKAYETIRDTIGEKPANDINLTATTFTIGLTEKDDAER